MYMITVYLAIRQYKLECQIRVKQPIVDVFSQLTIIGISFLMLYERSLCHLRQFRYKSSDTCLANTQLHNVSILKQLKHSKLLTRRETVFQVDQKKQHIPYTLKFPQIHFYTLLFLTHLLYSVLQQMTATEIK